MSPHLPVSPSSLFPGRKSGLDTSLEQMYTNCTSRPPRLSLFHNSNSVSIVAHTAHLNRWGCQRWPSRPRQYRGKFSAAHRPRNFQPAILSRFSCDKPVLSCSERAESCAYFRSFVPRSSQISHDFRGHGSSAWYKWPRESSRRRDFPPSMVGRGRRRRSAQPLEISLRRSSAMRSIWLEGNITLPEGTM